MDTENVRSAINRCFDQLAVAIDDLVVQLPKHTSAVWFPEDAPDTLLSTAFTDYWYRDNRDGRITNTYFAVVQASQAYRQKVQNVNRLKSQFRTLCAQLRLHEPAALRQIQTTAAQRHPTLGSALEHHHLARLHIKQLTRLIPVLSDVPQKLAYHWYGSGRSIKRITKKQAWIRLQAMDQGRPHIEIQLQALSTLPDAEPLAIVQELAPIMRLNVTYENGRRQAQNIAMPLFIPEGAVMPVIVPPQGEKPTARTRRRRSDNVLEDQAFLPSLRVYRYRAGRTAKP